MTSNVVKEYLLKETDRFADILLAPIDTLLGFGSKANLTAIGHFFKIEKDEFVPKLVDAFTPPPPKRSQTELLETKGTGSKQRGVLLTPPHTPEEKELVERMRNR